jgi:hypothetical protein
MFQTCIDMLTVASTVFKMSRIMLQYGVQNSRASNNGSHSSLHGPDYREISGRNNF